MIHHLVIKFPSLKNISDRMDILTTLACMISIQYNAALTNTAIYRSKHSIQVHSYSSRSTSSKTVEQSPPRNITRSPRIALPVSTILHLQRARNPVIMSSAVIAAREYTRIRVCLNAWKNSARERRNVISLRPSRVRWDSPLGRANSQRANRLVETATGSFTVREILASIDAL